MHSSNKSWVSGMSSKVRVSLMTFDSSNGSWVPPMSLEIRVPLVGAYLVGASSNRVPQMRVKFL